MRNNTYYWETLNCARIELVQQAYNIYNQYDNDYWEIENMYVFGEFMKRSQIKGYNGIDIFIQLRTKEGKNENEVLSEDKRNGIVFLYKDLIKTIKNHNRAYIIHLSLTTDNMHKLGSDCKYKNDTYIEDILNQDNICIVRNGEIIAKLPQSKKCDYKYAIYFKKTNIEQLDETRYQNLVSGIQKREIKLEECQIFVDESNSDNLYALLEKLVELDITLYTHNYDSIAMHSITEFSSKSSITDLNWSLFKAIIHAHDIGVKTDAKRESSTGMDFVSDLEANMENYAIGRLLQAYLYKQSGQQAQFGNLTMLSEQV